MYRFCASRFRTRPREDPKLSSESWVSHCSLHLEMNGLVPQLEVVPREFPGPCPLRWVSFADIVPPMWDHESVRFSDCDLKIAQHVKTCQKDMVSKCFQQIFWMKICLQPLTVILCACLGCLGSECDLLRPLNSGLSKSTQQLVELRWYDLLIMIEICMKIEDKMI